MINPKMINPKMINPKMIDQKMIDQKMINPKMISKRMVNQPGSGVLAVAAAAFLVAGCSVGATSGAPASAVPSSSSSTASVQPSSTASSPAGPASSASSSSSPSSTSSASVGTGKDALPDAFPLPEGADVGTVVRDDNQIAAQITLSDSSKAYDFWRSALPKAGYTVTKAESVSGSFGEIRFRGHGCVGNSQIAVTGSNAEVQCDLG